MKLAIVLPAFAAQGVNLLGGGERYAVNLARALRRDVDVTLVTYGPRYRRGRYQDLPHVIVPAIARSAENPIPLTSFFLRARFDLVHAFQLRSASTSMLTLMLPPLRIPLVVTDVGGGGRSLIFRARLYRRVAHFICISEFSRGLLPVDVRDRASVVLGGIDLARYPYAPGERQRQAVLVARLMPHKGIDNLIKAAADDVEVVIAGRVAHPRYFHDLQTMARGTRVRFLLGPSDDAVLQLYRESAVTVSASVCRDLYGRFWPQSELLGLTLLESMATGTPVICTRVGGMPEYVRDGETGFIVPPNDPAAIRARMLQLFDDPASARRMGEAGRRQVESMTWDQVAERVLETYRLLDPAAGEKVGGERRLE